MVSRLNHVTIDCADAFALAQFWSAVTAWPLAADDEPGDPEAVLLPPDGSRPQIMFEVVPEGKTVKNRVHFDISPTERTRDEEVERLVGLGAALVDDRRRSDGSGWAVLADPEGNEFCVERSDTERSAAERSAAQPPVM